MEKLRERSVGIRIRLSVETLELKNNTVTTVIVKLSIP